MHVGRGIQYNQIFYILYLCKLNYTEMHCIFLFFYLFSDIYIYIFYIHTYRNILYRYVYHNIYQMKFDSRKKYLASICHCKFNDNYYVIESIREVKYK